MNEDVKVEWVAKLRDPNTKQARGVLTRVNSKGEVLGNCCLGVLCEIAVEHGVIEPGVDIDYKSRKVRRYLDRDGGDTYTVLPRVVAEWADLPTVAGSPTTGFSTPLRVTSSGRKQYNLAEVNDGGANFQTIATLIEEKF